MTSGEQWRIERAHRMAVVVDAENYFRYARRSMLQARRRIMLVGWDFDARILLEYEGERLPGEPKTVGEFLLWLVRRNPDLEIYLLRWDVGAIKSLFRGSTFLTVLRWMRHRRIQTKLDGHHPTGGSHHQKIVVIDDCFAFCGGIDMTGDRWDTRAHSDGEPRRRKPNGRPYKPWHDATSAVEGPVAAALGELARERWQMAGGRPIAPVGPVDDCWPDELPVDFTDIDVKIARTVPTMGEDDGIHEVEALFLAQIAAVRRTLYVESQYFASRRIAEAIARRLDEEDGPEFVIVNPVTAQGWLEPLAMDTARARLMTVLQRRDRHGRLRMYHPHTEAGEPIYCHAKILVADDRVFRLGSSNMNNRSLRLDTECDLTIEAKGEGKDGPIRAQIAAIRDDLLAEHLGVDPATVTARIGETGSLIAAIESLRGIGRTLVPYVVPEISDMAKWLADNEVLDPEGPEQMFEPLARRGLLRRLRQRRTSKSRA